MVVCKFFLQGTCKFGNSCKFDHHLTDYAVSPLHNQPQTNSNPTTSNIDTKTLVKAVVNDMTGAEKGGQWILSSYAPFRDKPAFPGFEDQSMEEIRFLFYEARNNGTVDQYRQNLQMMLQQAMMRIKSLQNPSPDAINMLKTIYNTTPSSANINNQSVFGSQPQQTSVFGNQTTNQQPGQSIFGNTNTGNQTTNQQPGQSIFGNTNTGGSIFNSGGSNSMFANQNQVKPIFGNPTQAPNQTKSVFGNTTTQAVNPNTSIFGNPTQTPIFGSPNQATNQSTSIFGNPIQVTNQNQSSIFANQNQNTSMFVQTPASNSIFSNTQASFTPQPQTTTKLPTQSIFQNSNQFAPTQSTPSFISQQVNLPQSNKPALQHSQSIFGNILGQPSATGVIGGTPQVPKPNPEFYSKREDLTEDEINWFESDDLDVSKIPEKPPTYEMCFPSR